MSMQRPKFTLLIPTVGRCALLKSTVEGLLQQDYGDFEIVVSDNLSADATQEVLQGFAAVPRVRHVRTSRRLSMPDHWEFAMEHARGEHIVILGDDDGLATNALRVLDDVIGRTGANLVSWRQATYYHPDWPGTEADTLFIPTDCTGEVSLVSPQKVLNDYPRFALGLFPNLLRVSYSMDLFRRAKALAGQVFVGAPDYSCPALFLMDPQVKYVSIDAVIGVGGKSKISNASASVHARDRKLTEYTRTFLAEFGKSDPYPHHEPKIWSVSNAMAAALSYARWHYPEVKIETNLDVAYLFRQTVGEIERSPVPVAEADVRSFKDWLEKLPPEYKRSLPNSYGVEAMKVSVADFLKRPFQPLVRILGLDARFRLFVLIRTLTGRNARFLWALGANVRWFPLPALGHTGIRDAMMLVERLAAETGVPNYSPATPVAQVA